MINFPIYKPILTEEETLIIKENIIVNKHFPMFVGKSFSDLDNYYLVHVIVDRLNHPNDQVIPNSFLYEFFLNITERECSRENISFNKITRCAINCNFQNSKYKLLNPHTDAEYPHNMLIIYLNDVSKKEGYNTTIIFNEKRIGKMPSSYNIIELEKNGLGKNFSILNEYHPKEGYGLFFNGSHYHSGRPTNASELRYICVINFV